MFIFNFLLLPLRFELHFHSSNILIRPASDWADNLSNRVASGVANQIIGVVHVPPQPLHRHTPVSITQSSMKFQHAAEILTVIALICKPTGNITYWLDLPLK